MKNFTSGFLLLSFGVVVASACGGNSSSFSGGTGGSSGKAGAGGGAGKGGAAGAATGGSGGSSGAGASGGAGGKAGSTGSGGKGATGGSAGSGTGGSGEAGEGASGGTAGTGTGGTAGMGGVAAMTGYHPPDEQIDACTLQCTAAAEAMCENSDPLAQCISDCRFGIRIEACSDDWDTLFACTEDSDPVCNGEGEATWPDCVSEYAAVLGCVLDDAMDPDLDAPCASFCDAQNGVMCDNSPAEADCTQECGLIGSAVPVCKAQYTAYLECAGDADFMCDAAGDPQPMGCVATSLPFLACVVTEYDITF